MEQLTLRLERLVMMPDGYLFIISEEDRIRYRAQVKSITEALGQLTHFTGEMEDTWRKTAGKLELMRGVLDSSWRVEGNQVRLVEPALRVERSPPPEKQETVKRD